MVKKQASSQQKFLIVHWQFAYNLLEGGLKLISEGGGSTGFEFVRLEFE